MQTDITKIQEQAIKVQNSLGRLCYADELADFVGCDVARIITIARFGSIRLTGLVHPANRDVARRLTHTL